MHRAVEPVGASVKARSAHVVRPHGRACASCGSPRQVVRKPEYGMVPFCADCIDRSMSYDEWDDLGEVD